MGSAYRCVFCSDTSLMTAVYMKTFSSPVSSRIGGLNLPEVPSCATGALPEATARTRNRRTALVRIQHPYAALESSPCASCTQSAPNVTSFEGTSHLRAFFLASYALQIDQSVATRDFHRRLVGHASPPPPRRSTPFHEDPLLATPLHENTLPAVSRYGMVDHCRRPHAAPSRHSRQPARRMGLYRISGECVPSAECLAGMFWRHILLNDTLWLKRSLSAKVSRPMRYGMRLK